MLVLENLEARPDVRDHMALLVVSIPEASRRGYQIHAELFYGHRRHALVLHIRRGATAS